MLQNIMNRRSKTMPRSEQRGASASANAFRHLSPNRKHTNSLLPTPTDLDDLTTGNSSKEIYYNAA